MPVSHAGQSGFDRVADVGRRVVVGQWRGTAMKKRVRLDRQLIEGKMRRQKFQRGRDVRVRIVGPLAGQRIHEIQVDVAEDLERRRGGGARFAFVVHTPERHKVRGIEALHAQRQAIDARKVAVQTAARSMALAVRERDLCTLRGTT